MPGAGQSPSHQSIRRQRTLGRAKARRSHSSAADRNLVDAYVCAQVLRGLGMRPAAETADALAPWLAKVEAALASPAGVKNMKLVMWKIDQSPPFVVLPDEEDTPEQKVRLTLRPP